MSESFNIEVGVRQGCMMSSWLFNICMYGVGGQLPEGVKSFYENASASVCVCVAPTCLTKEGL